MTAGSCHRPHLTESMEIPLHHTHTETRAAAVNGYGIFPLLLLIIILNPLNPAAPAVCWEIPHVCRARPTTVPGKHPCTVCHGCSSDISGSGGMWRARAGVCICSCSVLIVTLHPPAGHVIDTHSALVSQPWGWRGKLENIPVMTNGCYFDLYMGLQHGAAVG